MKAKLVLVAVCLMLASPLSAEVGSATGSIVYAGHTRPGGVYCSPCCEAGPCYCDEGEQPEFSIECEGEFLTAQPSPQASTRGPDLGSAALVAAVLIAMWLRARFLL